MSALQAIPTQHGIDVLNSELKNTVTKYRLIGSLTHDAPNESLYSFYENTIETSYYDDNGVLTFILNLPIEQHFDEYLHQIHVLDSNDQSVIECSTPKVALAKGIGGMVTLKASISGEAGEVIFKHGEFVTETELLDLHFSNLKTELLAQRVGETWESHNPNSVAGWIELNGGGLSRITDALLWQYAQRTGLIVNQILKQADPNKYAMYFGDGNGATTFSLPNHHLSHFVRGNPTGVAHGEIQEDAIRNIQGYYETVESVSLFEQNGTGPFYGINKKLRYANLNTIPNPGSPYTYPSALGIDASRVVPTADENRPYTANLSIKIHRGWL